MVFVVVDKNFLYLTMNENFDLVPGAYVINKDQNDWGIGQIQSCIEGYVTVNFENVGKKVIISSNIELRKVDNL